MLLIAVYKCDNCPEFIALRTEQEWQDFQATWAESLSYQYCGRCKNFPALKTKIAAEDKRVKDALTGLENKTSDYGKLHGRKNS